MGDVRTRVAESLDELRALDAEIAAWHARWDTSYAIGKHRTQLDLLSQLTRGLIDILIGGTSKIDLTANVGAVYAECRQTDDRLHYARRLWRYYADKFDQRAGSENDPLTRTLRAADEVIWSCWKTALNKFGALPGSRMPAPLAYLSPQFAASTTQRNDYPRDLSPDLHRVFADHVRQLSIPVIALPPLCQRRPWWLVVAAHEVGHHVQWTLPGVKERTQKAVVAATGRLAPRWQGWHQELFADACAVLLTGPAVIWAVAELETRPAPAPGAVPHPRYPPAAVRLAMARAVADQAGLPGSGFAAGEARASADFLSGGDDVAELLVSVPAVAGALLGVTSDTGAELRDLAGAYDESLVRYWGKALLRTARPVPRRDLGAARFCVAGSVAAWQSVAGQDIDDQDLADQTASLAGQVRAVLPDCAEQGRRGGLQGRDIEARAKELARRFADDLYAIAPLAGDQPAGDELAGGADQP